MEPLGVISYIRNNHKRLIASMIIVSLSSFILYFTFGIGNAVKKGLVDENLEPYKNMTIYFPFTKEVRESSLSELKNMKEIDKIIECDWEGTTVDMIVGKSGASLFKINKADIKSLLGKMDLKLLVGGFPENKNEMILNERVLRGLNKKVGDYIGDEVEEKSPIKGKYKVVGAYSGKDNSFIVCDDENYKKGIFIVFGKEGKQQAINKYLNTINKEDRNLVTLDYMRNNIGSIEGMLYVFGIIICGIFVVVLSIIIWNIIYINMLGRKKELALIKSIGYSNKYIRIKLFKENVVTFFMAVILGNVFGILGLKVFYEIYCYPKGFQMDIFSPIYVLVALIVPFVVLLFSLIPISRGIKKIDNISVLDGNA